MKFVKNLWLGIVISILKYLVSCADQMHCSDNQSFIGSQNVKFCIFHWNLYAYQFASNLLYIFSVRRGASFFCLRVYICNWCNKNLSTALFIFFFELFLVNVSFTFFVWNKMIIRSRTWFLTIRTVLGLNLLFGDSNIINKLNMS